MNRARAAAGALLVLAAGCASRERAAAVARLSAASPKDRAAAVETLARTASPGDDETWAALLRSAHDGSPLVRAAAAGALLAAPRDDALDAVGGLLRDPDDAVRVAAAQALGRRCGDRARAYLRLGFARSDARVREVVAEALSRCGASLEQTFALEEAALRAAASKLLAAQSGAQRARGALQLGRLGRAQDVAALLPLLDDRDGTVVAAAAEALGEAGAQAAAPRLGLLLAEPGEVAGAAAAGLRALGQVAAFRAPLSAVAARDSDEADEAALALGPDCDAALHAQRERAAALLARDCPAGPLVRRLAQRPGPGATLAALEALRVARGPAPGAAGPLSALLAAPDPALAARACRVAEALGVVSLGPSLLALIRRERRALEAERARRPARPDDDEAAAAVSAQEGRAQEPSRARYDQLMAKLAQHQGAVETRASAQDQLAALLRGGVDGDAGRRGLLRAALHAARALQAPGTAQEAKALAADPDRLLAAAARGEEPAVPAATPASAAPAPEPAGAAPALAALRAGLWSDDGRERAAACAALAARADAVSEPTRRALGSDPLRRVRAACALANETAKPKKG